MRSWKESDIWATTSATLSSRMIRALCNTPLAYMRAQCVRVCVRARVCVRVCVCDVATDEIHSALLLLLFGFRRRTQVDAVQTGVDQVAIQSHLCRRLSRGARQVHPQGQTERGRERSRERSREVEREAHARTHTHTRTRTHAHAHTHAHHCISPPCPFQVYTKASVPEYGPALPNPPVFTDMKELRKFLLVKRMSVLLLCCVTSLTTCTSHPDPPSHPSLHLLAASPPRSTSVMNGEKAALASPTASFAVKKERTLEALINDVAVTCESRPSAL